MNETTDGHNNSTRADLEELEGFFEELRDKRLSVTEAAGRLRSRIKAILEETGYHKGAFDVIRKIDDMSEESRADFLRSFEPLYEVMLEGKWNLETADLLSRIEADQE